MYQDYAQLIIEIDNSALNQSTAIIICEFKRFGFSVTSKTKNDQLGGPVFSISDGP